MEWLRRVLLKPFREELVLVMSEEEADGLAASGRAEIPPKPEPTPDWRGIIGAFPVEETDKSADTLLRLG